MSDARDPQALIAAAEQAVAAGAYASAEKLLREAAALQEARLGPLHADLANTLNNLAVTCEMADNPVDAEHYFRRACAIATAILEPDHPFVATSRKNLEDFCAARGKPVKLPGAVSLVTAKDHVPLTAPHSAPSEHQTMAEQSMPAPPASTHVPERRMARGIIAAAVMAGLLLTIAAAWLGSGSREDSSVTRATTTRPEPQTPAPASASMETMPSGASVEATVPESVGGVAEPQKAPPTTSTTGLTVSAENRAERGTVPPSPAQRPVVAVAELCRTLSTRGPGGWRCVPPEHPLSPGPLVFYTRLRTPTGVTVQHRWYRGDRVHRVVDLRIGANALEGYRTYSRNTVDALGKGDWRVELTTRDGTVLHEERFVVR
jgi:hypothetical protein